MKQSLLLGLAAAALLAGCNDGKLPGGWSSTTGGIAPAVNVDASVSTGSRAVTSAKAIEAADLSLRLTAADGSLDRTWARVADFDTDEEFSVGDYTMQAFYGTEGAEGFDAPYYSGTTALTVRENQVTPVNITASLANSMVSITYTDALKTYLADWDAMVSSSAGKTVVNFAKDETRPAYITPGAITLRLNITKPSGTSATLQAATFTAQPRHHYNVTVDLNDGEVGEGVLTITYVDDTEEKTIDIDLSEDIISAPAPEVTTVGFASGDVLTHVESASADAQLALNIVARGGLASVMMTTESASLRQQGWPADIDLIGTDAATQTTLRNLGLKPMGLWKNPDKMAVIDLTDVLAHLTVTAAGATDSKLTFTVTDRYSKTSDPVELTVSVVKLVLDITGHEPLLYDADNVDLHVAYNGSNLADNVAFQTKNERGTWDNVEVNSITADSDDAYTVNLKLPARADKALTFRAVAKTGLASAEVEVPVVEPNVTLEASDNNTFATYAIVKAGGEAAEGMTFEYSADGGLTYTTATSAVRASAARSGELSVKVGGLPSGKTLLVRVNDADHASRPVTITTEAATQPDHADMDTWKAAKKGDYQYLWTIGDGSPWGTLNEQTTSTSGSGSGNGLNTGGCAYKATSGTIPANGRSTQSEASGGAIGTTKHSDGHTEGVDNIHSNKQNSGSNAALIRTIGWGSGNAAGASSSAFGTCQNATAGELYLGSYDGDKPVLDFASRPSAISFFYHYDVVTPGNGDYGTVEIALLDANGTEIFPKVTRQLTEQAEYTQVTIPFSYEDNAAKAAKISLVFKSSANDTAINTKNTTYWHKPGSKNTSGGEFVGSELYIDDIELIY